MAEAFYHHGFTIEYEDKPALRLKIDGVPVRVVRRGKRFVAGRGRPPLSCEKLPDLGCLVVEHLPGFKERGDTQASHEQLVGRGRRGRRRWNDWRLKYPHVTPLLYGANLSHRDLRGYDFSYANLTGANLRYSRLQQSNLHQANLGGAKLFRANLTDANLCRTDLYKTQLHRANLTNANLQGTGLVAADFRKAKLIGCRVYGMSAWDLKLTAATQKQLRIRYDTGRSSRAGVEIDELPVDDLETAQLLFFLLRNRNENITKLIDAMSRQIVLILGRFTPKRKAVLNKLRDHLRDKKLIAILFDFEPPRKRDFTETVSTIAHLARFAIADLTDASSIPQELQRIVPSLPSLPIQPIIQARKKTYAMFRDFGGYRSVLRPFPYRDPAHLLKSLDEHIIAPVEKRANEIQQARRAFERALFEPDLATSRRR
jgi:uncharacterized protein YjbI with pentapeptide repeats